MDIFLHRLYKTSIWFLTLTSACSNMPIRIRVGWVSRKTSIFFWPI